MKYEELLQHYRDQIDTIDLEMIYLLSRRFEIVKQIGLLKKEDNKSPLQTWRWQELMKLLKEEARERGVNEEFIEKIWNEIHTESLRLEK